MSDVIEASSVTVKTMADGTLRLSVDIEPRFARAAFGLFGSPGTPMALAALKGAGQAEEKPERQQTLAGPLCKWVAIRCKEPEFQAWIETQAGTVDGSPEEWAAYWVRESCGVSSLLDIDGNPVAEARFRTLIRQPYADWLAAR